MATVGVLVGLGGVVGASLVWSAASGDDAPAVAQASAVEPEDEPAGDEPDGGAPGSGLPPEIRDLVDGVEAFAECVERELDLGTEDGAPIPSVVDGPGTVIVLGPDGELTVAELGDGDGRVIVDKSGDGIEVEVSGDATAYDGSDLEDLLTTGFADLGDALEACRDELPSLPAVGEVLEGLDPGRLPGLDDLPLDELPGLDELPSLDELPGLDELQDVPLDELLDDLIEQLPPELRDSFTD